VTTSLMVGRSKPGCDLCPALSFKDLHHPCWGGGQAEPELYLPYGPAGHLLLQHSGERALTGLACSWAVLPLLRYDASAWRSVLARPGGPEWGSAGGQMAAVVGAEVVVAEEVLVADEIAATICTPGLRLFGFDSLSSPLE
jgi:hypothetical protein